MNVPHELDHARHHVAQVASARMLGRPLRELVQYVARLLPRRTVVVLLEVLDKRVQVLVKVGAVDDDVGDVTKAGDVGDAEDVCLVLQKRRRGEEGKWRRNDTRM